jgi:hypothetical protein
MGLELVLASQARHAPRLSPVRPFAPSPFRRRRLALSSDRIGEVPGGIRRLGLAVSPPFRPLAESRPIFGEC